MFGPEGYLQGDIRTGHQKTEIWRLPDIRHRHRRELPNFSAL